MWNVYFCMSMTGKVTFVLQVECGSFGLLILAFFLSFLFLYLWVEVPKDYNDFDWWVSPCSFFIDVYYCTEIHVQAFRLQTKAACISGNNPPPLGGDLCCLTLLL